MFTNDSMESEYIDDFETNLLEGNYEEARKIIKIMKLEKMNINQYEQKLNETILFDSSKIHMKIKIKND